MGGSKLKTIHVAIIGIFACLVVIVGLYFLVITKANERIKGLQDRLQKAQAEWDLKASVEAQLQAAKQQYRMVNVKYEKYLDEKMPPISFQDRAQGMIALWKEQAETLGPMVASWPARTGVQLMSGVRVPAAPVDPNAISTNLIVVPLGGFQVRGDFRTVLSHIRSWNKFNRLVMISPVSLRGPSPGMTAEYGVTVFIFPRGEAGSSVPMVGSSTGGAPAGAPIQ